MSRKQKGEYLPLTEEHKARVRAGILASKVTNCWSPDEEATARNLYERGVGAAEIAQTINALYKRGRTDQAIGSHMHRIGARFGSALGPDEIAADEGIRRRMKMSTTAKLRFHEAERLADEERKCWHPLKDNQRLLEVLAR